MATQNSRNAGCGSMLILFFFLGFVTTLGVRLALHILGL